MSKTNLVQLKYLPELMRRISRCLASKIDYEMKQRDELRISCLGRDNVTGGFRVNSHNVNNNTLFASYYESSLRVCL